MKGTSIISHNPICLFTIQKMSLYLIDKQVCTFLREPNFKALDRMYSVMDQVDNNFRHRHHLGGCLPLAENALRPYPSNSLASAKTGGGSIGVY
jgi:hypothetical protein